VARRSRVRMAAVGDRVAVPLPSHYRPDLQEDREHDKPGRRHQGENGVDEQYQAVLSADHLDGMRVDPLGLRVVRAPDSLEDGK